MPRPPKLGIYAGRAAGSGRRGRFYHRRSSPVGAVKRAVSDRLADVLRAYLARVFEVGDGAAHLQYAVVGARRQAQTAHRRFEHPLALGVHAAVLADEPRRHLGVRENAVAREPRALPLARAEHPRANLGRALGLRERRARKLFELHRRHVNVDVDAVEERPRDAADVTLYLRGRASALARRVVPEAARAGVHRRGEHERGREGQGH